MSTIKVSIVIVTHNSESTITFCLESVLKSSLFPNIEIIIIDNNSRDRTKYFINTFDAEIRLIENNLNVGFSKACNQGAKIANSDVLLFLNPDCMIEEQVVERMLDSLLQMENAGAIGPLLIDGSGNVLPESAREIPNFKSGIFQYLNINPKFQTGYHKEIASKELAEAPILSGACLIIKKEIFELVSGFDERYFMYGEDIDLSVDLLEKGYHNFCLTTAKVLHFKGESTNKYKWSYHWNFNNAIRRYLEKRKLHKENIIVNFFFNTLFLILIISKYVRSQSTRYLHVIVDFVLIIAVFLMVQFLWSFIKSGDWDYYQNFRYISNYIFYSIVIILFLLFNGIYFEKYKGFFKLLKAIIYSGLTLLVIYGLLPESQRFSRMILLLSFGLIPVILYFRHFLFRQNNNNKNILLSADPPDDLAHQKAKYLNADVNSEIMENSNIYFDTKVLPVNFQIYTILDRIDGAQYILWDRVRDITFSSSKSQLKGSLSDKYREFNIYRLEKIFQKRMLDVLVMIVIFIPWFILKAITRKLDFSNFLKLILGNLTLVGFDTSEISAYDMPGIKDSIVKCYQIDDSVANKQKRTFDYAANYSILDDVLIVAQKMVRIIERI